MDVPGYEQRSTAIVDERAEGVRPMDEDDIRFIPLARGVTGGAGQAHPDVRGVLLAALERSSGGTALRVDVPENPQTTDILNSAIRHRPADRAQTLGRGGRVVVAYRGHTSDAVGHGVVQRVDADLLRIRAGMVRSPSSI